jgi:hypothetical protein
MATSDALVLEGLLRPRQTTQKGEATEEELGQVSRLMQMYEEAKNYKKDWTGSWKRSWEFYVGRQWGQRPRWKASPVENYVFSKVETMLPILTDNRPRVNVLPESPEMDEYTEAMQGLFSHWWDQLDMDNVVIQVTKNMLLYGKGFYYSFWDYDEKRICCQSVDPQNIYVDSDATSITDCRYLVHVSRMTKADVLGRWPDSQGLFDYGARTIPDEGDEFGPPSIPEHMGINVGLSYETAGQRQGMVSYTKSDLGSVAVDDDMVQVLQFWIRDPSLTVEPLKSTRGNDFRDKNGDQIMVEKAKYPYGRHIIVAGSRIIHDDENPYVHGRFPYVEQDCHQIPGEFWSISAVQNLISPQMELNKTLGQIIDNKNLMGNNQWVISKAAGIDPKAITGEPGLVLEKNPGAEVERIDAKPLPNYIIQFAQDRKVAMDDISGVFDVTQGRKPTGITAGVAIESLQEAAQTRLRALVRNLENAIARTGQQWVGLAQQFYDDARVVRVTDHQTGSYNFIELTPEKIRGNWQILVAAGSTLPRSREVRQAQAVELFQLGVFDAEALLEWIDHPGRDRLIARVKEQQAKEQELQAMGAQFKAGLGGAQGGGFP